MGGEKPWAVEVLQRRLLSRPLGRLTIPALRQGEGGGAEEAAMEVDDVLPLLRRGVGGNEEPRKQSNCGGGHRHMAGQLLVLVL